MHLSGKNILIMGASGGIGSEIAKTLLAKECFLFLHFGSHKDESLAGSNFKWLSANFKNPDHITDMFNEINSLDAVVNTVGIEKTSADPLDISVWKDIFEVNIFGAVKVAQEAVKKMNPGGVFLNISSIVGKEGITFESDSIAYPASKAALNKLTEGLSAIYSPKIRAVSVCLGYVKTPMWDRFDEETVSEALSRVPSKEFIIPKEVAEFVIEILENESLSGTLTLDRGLGLKRIY